MAPFATMSDALDFFDQFHQLAPCSFLLAGGDAYQLHTDGYHNWFPIAIDEL